MKTNAKLSLWKLAAYVGGFSVAVIGLLAIFLFVFGSAIVNGYAKNKLEKTFAKAHPGFGMRIGHLSYSIGANVTVAESVNVSGTNAIFKADRIELRGVHWARLFWGKPLLSDVFAKAHLNAANLDADFPQARYGVHCAVLRAAVPASELIAEGAEFHTLVGDKEFFAAHEFRATRFHVMVPECKVSGLAYDRLFDATSYQARSVEFSRPTFEALENLDKTAGPFVKSPLMMHEALAAIPQPFRIDSLRVTEGSISYSEQAAAGVNPATLTFTLVSLSAQGIANRGATSDAIALQGKGNLMDAGTLNLLMIIPIMPTNFSLRYSGSLSPMDLTRLNPFLDIDAHTRITSGAVKEADFAIDVTAGHARGRVRASYENLKIAFLDKKSGSANGIDNRVSSFLANKLKIRSSNPPELSGTSKEGEVNYIRKPDEEFQQFLWFALRTGVLDIISH